MTWLITGGLGYIGLHVASALRAANRDVFVIDIVRGGYPKKWSSNLDGPSISVADFGNVDALTQIFESRHITGIIHLAATTSVTESLADPLTTYHNNVAKTITLLNTAYRHGIMKIVFASSASVYSTRVSTPMSENTSDLGPISPYGWSKLAVERVLHDIRMDFQAVTLRLFNVAGLVVQPRWLPNSMIPNAVDAVMRGRPLLVHDVDSVRDYVHVSDVARAFVNVVKRLEADDLDLTNVVMNIGTGVGTTVSQVINRIESVLEARAPISQHLIGPRPGNIPYSVADITKAKKIIGWEPQHDLDEIILGIAANHVI